MATPAKLEGDARLETAVMLSLTTQLSKAQIAKAAGYASASAVSNALNGTHAGEMLSRAAETLLLRGQSVGLGTLTRLALKGKSEATQLSAARELLDRCGLPAQVSEGGGGSVSAVQINIGGGGKSEGVGGPPPRAPHTELSEEPHTGLEG